MIIALDHMDRTLVNLLQSSFPLSETPFAELGTQLDLHEEEVLRRTEQLRDNNIIRILGPVFNSRALGYQSTLITMQVPDTQIDQAAEIINRHPGVGHNYQRDHHYNLWFTLASRGADELQRDIRKLSRKVGPEALLELPATRLFKIRLFFDLEGNGNHSEDRATVESVQTLPMRLSDADRRVINTVQGQLPLISRPFDEMAGTIDMTPKDFLSVCRSLFEKGIMRRFGASIEHQNAGFVANAMVCWEVPPERIDDVGNRMARYKEVTHCYERKTSTDWPRYNIFTMIHGNSLAENTVTIQQMSQGTGITEYEVLQTIREFKKERVRYEV